ncbi:MAG: phytanoyl-CoA dioxygenase family protein [Deltaproteobacteria bacterium]|nr:phytanoyl-CoA dioxygenase family protein [Deltaproteobacteria bacterium]
MPKTASLHHQKPTPTWLYWLHRKLFCWTNGLWNDTLTKIIQKKRPKVPIDPINSVLCQNPLNNVEDIIHRIHQDGYYVFSQTLPDQVIETITTYTLSTPVRYAIQTKEGAQLSDHKIAFAKAEDIDSPRFQMDTNDIFACPELVTLIFDPFLLHIAQEYLGSRPILDLISLWWSKPEKQQRLQNFAAQQYHFDMDRIKFLKFFFYLTDVTPETGPHCYVRGSHRNLAPNFRKDQRFDDQNVKRTYGDDNIITLCKPKGTMMAIDTRGLHKGMPLSTGHRLIFQIEFANSMFGQNYDKVPISQISPDIALQVYKNPFTYSAVFKK